MMLVLIITVLPTPLSQVGSVNTPDARTIVVQPWEKSLLPAIEKAIKEANLGC
jgi:ribosome recycling factor